MKNIIEYLKDKIYYILGGTIVLIILLIVISACSNKTSGTYEGIEIRMVNAAKKYYVNNSSKLPKKNDETMDVSINTLIDAKLLKEIKDPKNSANICTGYVEVTKVDSEYSYIPFLTCKGNYEPKLLTDKIKNVKTDEYGNGVYKLDNGEYVYRGDDVKNYISFNDQVWRIVKIDTNGDIKLVLSQPTNEYYIWDSSYNSEQQKSTGNTSNYLITDIRKTLKDYYNQTFSTNNKSKIVAKNICIGGLELSDAFSEEKECSKTKENEKISLLSPSDYGHASLDAGCKNLNSAECTNYNYLSSGNINTWLINTYALDNYEILYLNGGIGVDQASYKEPINPVIYLTNKVITATGTGTEKNPYIIK